MSRFNRVLILFGTLLLMSSSAMAFDDFPLQVRLESLAGDDPFVTSFWNDSNHAVGVNDWFSGISLGWYGELANYTDMLTISFEPEGGGGQGFWLNKSEESYGNYFVGLQMGDFDKAGGRQTGEYNHLTLGYGYPMESARFGIIFNRQNLSATAGDEEWSDTWHMIGLGVDYDLNEQTNLDVSFRYTMGNFKDTIADIDEDGNGFGLGARLFWEWKEGLNLIPMLTYQNAEYEEGYKQTFLGAGLGFAYTVNEDNDVVFGVDYQNYNEEWDDPDTDVDDYEFTWTAIPGIYLGVEHEFTDWLTIRSGATKNWETYELDEADVDITPEEKDFPFGFSLGAGIGVGDWQIDMGLNTTWLYNLGYWFHGNNESGNPPIASIQAKLFF